MSVNLGPTAPYNVRIVLYAADKTDPIFSQSVPIDEDDLKLGIPARVLARCTQELTSAFDNVTIRERSRRKTQPAQIVELQE